jgi:hypothetical protein
MHRLTRLAAIGSLAALLAGCELLLPGLYGFPEEPIDPGLGMSATYESGSATLRFGGAAPQTIELDTVLSGSGVSEFGAMVTWRNDDGWAMTVNAYEMGLPGVELSGDVNIQRIVGTEVWTTDSFTTPYSCTVDIDKVTEDELSGAATCRSLQWVDGTGGGSWLNPGSPRYVEGEPAFDVTITFEAQARAGADG